MPPLLTLVAAAPSPRPRKRPHRRLPAAAATFPTNQRVDRLRSRPTRRAIVASIGARRRRSTPTSAPAATRAGRSASPTTSSSGARRARACASTTPTSPTASATRSRAASTSRAAATPTATATRCCSTAAPAGSTSCSTSRAGPARWTRRLRRDLEPALDRGCGPPAGRRADAAGLPILPLLARHGEVQARPDRPRAARDRVRRRGARSSTPRGTSPPRRPTRRCRGWASGCG